MVVRAESDESIKAKTPQVDRSKPENIEAGNISNENAEKRADIGKTREPTPAGTIASGFLSHIPCKFCNDQMFVVLRRGASFRRAST